MNKQDYINKKNAPPRSANTEGFCGKCGQGMLNKDSVIIDAETERRLKAKYVRICDDCKLKMNLLPNA